VAKDKGNRLDRIARAISPRWYLRRQIDRLRAAQVETAIRRYDAASGSARFAGWHAPGTSANAEVLYALDKLRDRSRELVRNNPWAATAVRRLTSNIVGEGVAVALMHDKDAVLKRAQEVFAEHFETTACDADGRLTMAGLQRLMVREMIESGEVLLRRRARKAGERGLLVPVQFDMLEGDHLDETKTEIRRGTSSRIRMGIEFDATGARTAYHLFKEHPGDPDSFSTDQTAVPAAGLTHCYRVDRAKQIRGIPWQAPTATATRDLADWWDATLVRARLAACFGGVIESGNLEDPESSLTSATGKPIEEIEPGMLRYLREGEKLTLINPPGVEGMEEFPRFSLRAIAAGAGMPYEVLTGDLSTVNYSSARVGLLEFMAETATWRADTVIPHICEPMFRWWRDAAVVAGFEEFADLRASWTARTRRLLDPGKETEAAIVAIRGGLSTHSEELRAQGWNPDEWAAEFKADQERLDKLMIAVESDPRNARNAAAKVGGDDGNENNPPDAGSV